MIMESLNIVTNAMLVQFLDGIFTGFCCGILAPSEYEKNFSFAERKKVWKWQKYKPVNFFTLVFFVIKVVVFIGFIGYINIGIAKYFDVYPMSKVGGHLYIFGVCFFMMAFMAKWLRYLYFKSKISR